MKTTLRDEAVALSLLLAMFVLAAVMWPGVPDLLAVHWNWTGQADRLGGRFEALFGLPLAALILYLILLAAPRFDPRRAHYAAFAGPYRVLRTLVIGILLALQIVLLTSAGGQDTPSLALPAIIGISFVLVGNMLPKIQSNWFVGVRTPWTLSSEESWRRTHRLAGWLFVIGGGVTAVVGFVAPGAGMAAMVTTLGATAIASIVYSYLVWSRDPNRAVAADLD